MWKVDFNLNSVRDCNFKNLIINKLSKQLTIWRRNLRIKKKKSEKKHDMTRHDMTSNGRKEGWKGKARKGEGMEMLRRKRKGGD